MCKVLRETSLEKTCKASFVPCCCSGISTNSFKKDSNEMGGIHGSPCYTDIDTKKKVYVLPELQHNLNFPFHFCNTELTFLDFHCPMFGPNMAGFIFMFDVSFLCISHVSELVIIIIRFTLATSHVFILDRNQYFFMLSQLNAVSVIFFCVLYHYILSTEIQVIIILVVI